MTEMKINLLEKKEESKTKTTGIKVAERNHLLWNQMLTGRLLQKIKECFLKMKTTNQNGKKQNYCMNEGNMCQMGE